MKRPKWPANAKERRAAILAGVILLQALCATFFIGDVISDFHRGAYPGYLHFRLEAVAALALIGGIVFLMIELRRLLARMEDMDAGLMVARGQMAEVMQGFFDDWNLTRAERDVAIMILKGLDNEAIAGVRNTAPGTVRAQTASVYSKSGTRGRAQFVSLFMEELMAGALGESDADGAPPPAAEEAYVDKLQSE